MNGVSTSSASVGVTVGVLDQPDREQRGPDDTDEPDDHAPWVSTGSSSMRRATNW
jgi:hypothetical protein